MPLCVVPEGRQRGDGQAQESLATTSTPTEMGDFAETYVGLMVLKPDREIVRKQDAGEAGGLPEPLPTGPEKEPLHAGRVKRSIAGVGFEPTTSGL